MILPTPSYHPQEIVYPESDGKPMADNSKQFRWIVIIYTNLAGLFQDVADVYVIGNLLWYPVEGERELYQAPDVMVVFGRPKGDRKSYRQWEEDNVPVQVVFEILSPSNSGDEMVAKSLFYAEYGVEEYYLYNPDTNRLLVFRRKGEMLLRVWNLADWVSPRLGIRFDLSGPDLVIYRPDGQRFRTFEEIQADAEREKQRADREKQRADLIQQRSARLAELSRKVRRGQASAEELAELDRLEEEQLPPTS